MKIHILAMAIVVLLGFYFKLNLIEWCFITLAISLVIGAELFNTAIETTVDLAMPEKNEKAKLAKDVSAAAVLVCAITAAIVGLIIFVPKII